MRRGLIVIGVLAALGLALWLLSKAPATGPKPAESPKTPQAQERPDQPQQVEQPKGELAEFLCPGTEGAPKPEPRLLSLRVMAACVVVKGRVMFTSVLPNGDYLMKIWPSGKYAALREGCRPVATAELSLEEPYLVVTIAKGDWPKFSPILQPGGPGTPYKLAIPVTAQGVYVFSPQTNRHVYGPHCEIHPLESLEPLEEQEAGDEG